MSIFARGILPGVEPRVFHRGVSVFFDAVVAPARWQWVFDFKVAEIPAIRAQLSYFHLSDLLGTPRSLISDLAAHELRIARRVAILRAWHSL